MLLLLISHQGVLSEPYHGYAVSRVARPENHTLRLDENCGLRFYTTESGGLLALTASA
jgi:hypothetical protein